MPVARQARRRRSVSTSSSDRREHTSSGSSISSDVKRSRKHGPVRSNKDSSLILNRRRPRSNTRSPSLRGKQARSLSSTADRRKRVDPLNKRGATGRTSPTRKFRSNQQQWGRRPASHSSDAARRILRRRSPIKGLSRRPPLARQDRRAEADMLFIPRPEGRYTSPVHRPPFKDGRQDMLRNEPPANRFFAKPELNRVMHRIQGPVRRLLETPQIPRPMRIRARPPPVVDRSAVCPFFLRVYCRMTQHHSVEDFTKYLIRNDEETEVTPIDPSFAASELQLYTWKDTSLREIVDLVKDLSPEAASLRSARISLKLLHLTPKNSYSLFDLGSLHISRPGPDDRKMLSRSKFQIGDVISIAIFPATPRAARITPKSESININNNTEGGTEGEKPLENSGVVSDDAEKLSDDVTVKNKDLKDDEVPDNGDEISVTIVDDADKHSSRRKYNLARQNRRPDTPDLPSNAFRFEIVEDQKLSEIQSVITEEFEANANLLSHKKINTENKSVDFVTLNFDLISNSSISPENFLDQATTY